MVQMLIEHGEITRSDARNHPARSQITRFDGMPGEPLPEVRCIELHPGDRLLLCSDGLTNMVSDRDLFEVLGLRLSSEQICKRLVVAANKAGGVNNVTVVHLTE